MAETQDAAAQLSHCTIVRVVPNTAASMRESMTIVSLAPNLAEKEAVNRVSGLFSQLRPVVYFIEGERQETMLQRPFVRVKTGPESLK
jgi:pyrroline-5-carboxylate reductase